MYCTREALTIIVAVSGDRTFTPSLRKDDYRAVAMNNRSGADEEQSRAHDGIPGHGPGSKNRGRRYP